MKISVMSKVELCVVVNDPSSHPVAKKVWVPGTVLAVENFFGTYLINYLPPFETKYQAKWVSAEYVRLAEPKESSRIYYRFKYGCCMVVDQSAVLVLRMGPVRTTIEFEFVASNPYRVPSNVEYIDEEEFVNTYRQVQAEIARGTGIEDLVKAVEDARLRRETIADDVHNEPESQETEN